MQRMKSDMVTMDKREIADKTIEESRIRNDDLTRERRYKADRTQDMNRLRNDEATADRREIEDGSRTRNFVVSLVLLSALAVVAYFIFI